MRVRAAAGLLVAAALVLIAVVALGGGSGGSGHSDSSRPSLVGARAAAGSPARFAYLASQRSNRCDLQAAEIMSYDDGRRLQGSCCSPMDEHAYADQVRRLRPYHEISQIPRDPYDVRVSLVRRLFRYDRTIALSAAERRTYRHAMAMSDLKGPCCCPCWRWTAFRGLSKFLIHERRWRARRLANLIDALEGCGGGGQRA